MPQFAPGQTIRTRGPSIRVDRLPIGTHRFRLVVTGRGRRTSLPAELVVKVHRGRIRRGSNPIGGG